MNAYADDITLPYTMKPKWNLFSEIFSEILSHEEFTVLEIILSKINIDAK
jgi:hypothetical protein